MVEQVDHKKFLTLPKVCQGDSIKRAKRYLAKLNTLPDTFCLLCLMETPLADILAEDSCLDNPTPKIGELLYPTYSVIPFKARE